MQVWNRRRVAVLVALAAGSVGLMTSASAQTTPPSTIPGGGASTEITSIPGFPDFPDFPEFPTFPTSPTTTPPPTMPPSTSVTTTPPPTMPVSTFPTFTIPTIPTPPTMPPPTSPPTSIPPPTMPPTTIDVDDTIDEFLEDLLDRLDQGGEIFEDLRAILEDIVASF